MTEPSSKPPVTALPLVEPEEASVAPTTTSRLQEEEKTEDGQSSDLGDVLTDEVDISPSPTAPTSSTLKEQLSTKISLSTDESSPTFQNDDIETMKADEENEKVTGLPEGASPSPYDIVDTHPQPKDACNVKDVASRLLSLPIDSLHAIATFLSPIEWACFGQCNKASLRLTREVFRRVRMHGFRCATEIVTAWKLGQFADAKELCALYVEAGVPIYPRSLGHSYHTLLWRAAVEAKQLAALNNRNTQSMTNNPQGGETGEIHPIDPFYIDRHSEQDRDDDSSDRVSYLEEKAWYVLKSCERKDALGNIRRLRRRVSFNNQDLGRRAMMIEPMVEGGTVDDASLHRPLPRVETNVSSETSNSQRRGRSYSHSELRCVETKELIRIHRHLLDQHLLGRNSVNDSDGMMYTAPFSMSIDFFHPSFSVKQRCSSTRGYAATSAFASSSDGFVQGHLLPVWNNQTAPSAGGTDTTAMGIHSWLQNRQHLIPDVMDDSSSENEIPGQRPAPLAESIFEPSRNDVVEAAHRPILHSSLSSYRSPNNGRPTNFLKLVDLEVYSTASVETKLDMEHHELKSHLRTRFAAYQELLEGKLARRDNDGFEECVLDFWDEFFPESANIHYYDCRTAVPRISRLPEFLSTPCPKGIGTVQCEIKRIKLTNNKKGVNMKGRFFPTYEYRLFIRHNPVEYPNQSTPCRKDTVLMTARTRGRKLVDTPNQQSQVHSNTKKGANNYFLHTPLREDVVQHYSAANETIGDSAQISNGCSNIPASDSSSVLMGRLQSNFIGTEFQIFTPLVNPKNRNSIGSPQAIGSPHRFCPISQDEECGGHDSSASCENPSRRKNRFGRLSLKRSNTGQLDRASSVEPEAVTTDNPARSFRRRSRSSGDMPPKRTNRRAIANTNVVPDQTKTQTNLLEEENGAITYTANLLGSRPRIMDVCVPKVSEADAVGTEWKNYLEKMDTESPSPLSSRMLNHLKLLQQRMENEETAQPTYNTPDNYLPPDDYGLLALQNRPPWWNVELGSFVLNFGGRVSVASVKNFQLCDKNNQDYVMLQFGRIQGRHSFTMDFQHPLTAVQAFAIAISSLQSKISFG